MTNLVTWTDESKGGWEHLSGQSKEHRYYATRISEYGLGQFPWLVTRDDGWQTRVTHSGWAKEFAERAEEDPKWLHHFWTNIRAEKRNRKEELQRKREQ